MKATTWLQLAALRGLVGIAEAFVQGAVLYLSFWYTYSELALRGAIFQSVSSLAGAFNGLLSYGISRNLAGQNGWDSWQWIFLVEGAIPIGFAFVVFLCLPSVPEESRWFSERERAVLVERARRIHNTEGMRIRPRLVGRAVGDVKIILIGGCRS